MMKRIFLSALWIPGVIFGQVEDWTSIVRVLWNTLDATPQNLAQVDELLQSGKLEDHHYAILSSQRELISKRTDWYEASLVPLNDYLATGKVKWALAYCKLQKTAIMSTLRDDEVDKKFRQQVERQIIDNEPDSFGKAPSNDFVFDFLTSFVRHNGGHRSLEDYQVDSQLARYCNLLMKEAKTDGDWKQIYRAISKVRWKGTRNGLISDFNRRCSNSAEIFEQLRTEDIQAGASEKLYRTKLDEVPDSHREPIRRRILMEKQRQSEEDTKRAPRFSPLTIAVAMIICLGLGFLLNRSLQK